VRACSVRSAAVLVEPSRTLPEIRRRRIARR
jgi:predicted secreted Zn-dependent protease